MRRVICRCLGGLFIITALLLTQIPASLTEAASKAKEDFLLDNNRLVQYTGTATTVSVSNEINVIGEEAFANNQFVGVVNIGTGVKKIEHGAFANCNYINRIIIPDNVEEVDSAAFSGCLGLKTVVIGSGITKFGDGVFAGCKNLAGIDISRNNNSLLYEVGVLYDDKKEHIYTYLTANSYDVYYMPNSVVDISPYSFWGNEDLDEVYLSSQLSSIPAYSFSNCKELDHVQIPYSVKSIDAKAFENCVSLGDIEIPASVSYIDPTAFDGCINLNIIADEGTTAYDFFRNFDKSDIAVTESQDVKDIVHTGNENNSVTSPTSGDSGYIDASQDPSNVEWMPSVNPLVGAEDSSVLGKTIVVNGNAVLFVNRDMEVNQLTNYDVQSQNNSSTNDADIEESSDQENIVYDSGKGGYLPKYTYLNGKVASQAYYASKNEEDFVIPDETKEIGDFSYARSNVKNIDIPEGVESIGYGAFYHCDNLETVNIPKSVNKIDGYAFANTPFLDDCKEEFLIVGNDILLDYNGNGGNVIIPDGVKTISAGCFEGNLSINSVVLPDSLICIDSDAFRGCNSLSSVSGGANLEIINDRAFMNCPLLNYYVADSVRTIGLRAFDFTNSSLEDQQKVVVFEGTNLPKVSYDKTSSRLNNDEYRQDALFNVLFAVVDDRIDNFENTVLDYDTLGFSGIIVSIETDENGIETGKVNIKNNYIFSDDVMERVPEVIVIGNKEYKINNKDSVALSVNPYSYRDKNKELSVISTDLTGSVNANAHFSEAEKAGNLFIDKSDVAAVALNNAYAALFGGDSIDNLIAYDITLYDDKNVVEIDKLGKTVLYVTVPIQNQGSKYHVISLDEDGQLEELPCNYNSDDMTVTFQTTHLSYFGVYSTDDDNIVLNVKDGKVVKNYRLDSSPDTGDKSIPIYYILSLLLGCLGLMMVLVKKKK